MNCSVTKQYRLMYSGSWNYGFGLIFFLYSQEAIAGSLPHKRVDTNQRVADHNLEMNTRDYQTLHLGTN